VLAVPGHEDISSSLHPLVLVEAGYFARVQGDYAQATARGEEALATAQAHGDTAAMAAALFSLGLIALDRGELEQARTHHEAALRLESEREYSHGVAMQLVLLGEIAVAQGRLTEARALGEEALAIWRVRGDAWGMSWALLELGGVAHAEGDEAAAVSRYVQSLTSYTQLGDKEVIMRAIAELAAIACDREQYSLAARLYGGVYALREALSAPLSPVDRVRHEHAIAATRTALDNEAFTKAWDEGRAMTVESVIAEAERLDGEEGLRHRLHLRPS
jgi:tetratricopeptide (TPR) repeat protein